MAIVTFWNDNTGKIGQTYSALATSVLIGLENNLKTLLMSTEYGDQTVLNAFGIDKRISAIKQLTLEKNTMDLETGIEGMAKLILANRLTPEIVPNYTRIILKDRLEIVSAPKKKEGLDYNKLYNSCKDILNIADKYYDLILVDLNNRFNK